MGILNIIADRKQSDLYNTCRFLLEKAGARYTKKGLLTTLSANVEYPSMLSLKDSLFEYGVQSAAIKKGDHKYNEFETPFICSIQKEDWPKTAFTVVTKSDEENIEFLDPITGKLTILSSQEFEKIDKNIVLLLDTSTTKEETNFLENRKKERTEQLVKRTPLYLLIITLLLALGNILIQPIGASSWYSITFILTSFVGLLTSSLLIWHEIDAHNPFIKEVCGGSNKKLNCNAVLSSSKSSLFGISWSVWGFTFFATFFSTQIFFPVHENFILLWSGISILVAPYIVFSMYYQWKVVKQWCPLCLVIQCVLAINVIAAISYLFLDIQRMVTFEFYNFFTILFIGLSFLILSYTAIPVLKNASDSKNYKKKWEKLRYNPEIFNALLEKSERVNFPVADLGILIGNPQATNEIIKVCNPYCGPCSKAHPELEHIIKSNPDVRIRIIFTATGEEDDIRTPPVAHLFAIQQKLGHETAHSALDDWYMAPSKDYETFAKKYPMNGELKLQTEKIHAMWDWCKNMKIRATPTLYINGRELPDSYRIAELKNFF
ncbi:vitamin K epoxide reductase family protein [Sphingobacterium faecale]|uniref:Thioredoxin domain-containing protein n=1 Tax=Sphingobacterium faecale TaxID=2803775 RepID=A0ABS1R0I1_9SPHI|nr:vitamin K epoxide reductase family protein [Sphingobacterium faecale]MBL1408207.1 thioredoxin domain-containing protein [Sphingobacterium faecale]